MSLAVGNTDYKGHNMSTESSQTDIHVDSNPKLKNNLTVINRKLTEHVVTFIKIKRASDWENYGYKWIKYCDR